MSLVDHEPHQPEDIRRKRLRYQAWHRGMREMDLILGGFADLHLRELNTADLDRFERLLAVPDPTLYRWISDQEPVAPEYDTALLSRIRATAPSARRT